MTINIGCSGYSYPEWKVRFYPEDLRQEEMLPYYARHFGTIEINFSYYRLPTVKNFALMDRRTPEDFNFWVKAYQDFTHKGKMEEVGAFSDALAPLRESGKLAGVLLQFPQSFHYTPHNRRYLADLTEAMGSDPLAVEFRHRSWINEAVDDAFRSRGLSLVIVDVPKIEALYPPIYKTTNGVGYLRLHSRNIGNWYDSGEDRYDYHYSDSELREIIGSIQTILDSVEKLYVFFNNCKRAQAAENAERLRQLLNLPQRRIADDALAEDKTLWA